MAERTDGKTPTVEEIRKYADYLEQQLFAMNKSMTGQDKKDEASLGEIRLINLQQDRIMDDIRSINASLKDLQFSIGQMGILAQKQDDTAQATIRAHKRVDSLVDDFSKHRDKFDEALRKIEVKQATGAWLERVGMAIVFAAVAFWAKSNV